MTNKNPKLRALAERYRASIAAEEEAARKKAELCDELIPDFDHSRSPGDEQLEDIISKIDIVTAYNKWCRKSKVSPGKRREGIKISCPNPEHPDNNPSAWLNLDEGHGGVWYCAACDMGGDKFDIAAWHFNFPVPDYKVGKNFPDLRMRMAEDFGYVQKSSGGVTWIEKGSEPDPKEVKHLSLVQGEVVPGSLADIARGLVEDTPPLPAELFPSLDWRKITDDGTFLDNWMKTTSEDDLPEEFHYWHGLLALGFAVGRDVTLLDRSPVLGNLFICLVGHSGDGKSRSRRYLDDVLVQALPYRSTEQEPRGIKLISTPASAEFLIKQFNLPLLDDENNEIGLLPVRGLVKFNELSTLTSRASRAGNVIKPTLMEFYDGDSYISTGSISGGLNSAKDPYCSVHTTTQPRAFRDLVSQADMVSGFLNRWIFVGGKYKKRVSISTQVIETVHLAEQLKKIHRWPGNGLSIPLSLQAQKEFEVFYQDVLYPTIMADETDLLTRIDLTMKKLMLLLTINRQEKEVNVEIIRKLPTLYEYLLECYGASSAAIVNTKNNEIRSELLRHIKRLTTKEDPFGPTINELNKRIKNKNYDPKAVITVIEQMEKLGEILVTKTTRTKKYAYVS